MLFKKCTRNNNRNNYHTLQETSKQNNWKCVTLISSNPTQIFQKCFTETIVIRKMNTSADQLVSIPQMAEKEIASYFVKPIRVQVESNQSIDSCIVTLTTIYLYNLIFNFIHKIQHPFMIPIQQRRIHTKKKKNISKHNWFDLSES